MKTEKIFKGILLFSLFIMGGCSATAPPPNPYSCPEQPGYTVSTYCKPNKDPLLDTSVGQSWPVPYAYMLYTENSIKHGSGDTASIDTIDPGSSKTYVINPPTGQSSDLGASASIFTTSTDSVLAEYDSATTTPPEVNIGIFALDPDGKVGGGLDVSISWLATDSKNNFVGKFKTLTNSNVMPNGAGKKIKWVASEITDETKRLAAADYTLTASGFDEKNNTFQVQFKVTVQPIAVAKLK